MMKMITIFAGSQVELGNQLEQDICSLELEKETDFGGGGSPGAGSCFVADCPFLP